MAGADHAMNVEAYEAAFRLPSYGFAIRTSSPSLASLLESVFGGFRTDEATSELPLYELSEQPVERPRFTITCDGNAWLETDAPERVLDVLAWQIMYAITRRCDDRVLVHAGAVARAGSAVVLPAASGSGKTTLVAGLVAAGFSYLSDEIAAVLPGTGLVVPFPLALSIKEGSFEVLAGLLPDVPHDVRRFLDGRLPVPAGDIRSDAYGVPVPPRFVIVPRYVAGARTSLDPISRADGLGELVRNAFNLDRFGRAGFDLLARVVRDVTCYRLTNGDLDAAVRVVSDLVADEPA